MCGPQGPETPRSATDHGYEPLFDELGENLEQVIRTTQPPGGASFIDGKLTFVLHHPTIVHHVPQLLVIWGANIEGRPVQSYKQVLSTTC